MFNAVPAALAVSSSSGNPPPASSLPPAPPAHRSAIRPFSALGVGIKVSTLGASIEAATPLSRKTNLRAGFNMVRTGTSFSTNNINFSANLKFRSADALLDWMPFGGGFHISPGALLYNGNRITATAAVAGNQDFSLNHVDYESDPLDPVHGTASLTFSSAAPEVLMGFGNLVPRSKHFSVPFEVGTVFSGTPKVAFALTGSACNTSGQNCTPILTTPATEANVQAEQAKLNKDVEPYKYYPVLSLGIAYKFSWGKTGAK